MEVEKPRHSLHKNSSNGPNHRLQIEDRNNLDLMHLGFESSSMMHSVEAQFRHSMRDTDKSSISPQIYQYNTPLCQSPTPLFSRPSRISDISPIYFNSRAAGAERSQGESYDNLLVSHQDYTPTVHVLLYAMDHTRIIL